MWLGVVFGRVIVIEETAETTRARLLAGGGGGGADLRSFLAEYFQLGVSLEAQYEKWERSSPDYFTPEVSRMLAGVRVRGAYVRCEDPKRKRTRPRTKSVGFI